FALDPGRHQSAWLHHEIIRRVSPSLAAVPLTGGGWPEGLWRYVDRPPPPAPASATTPAAPATAASSPDTPLRAATLATLAPDRREVLLDAIGDGGNPAWELLDRAKALQAIDDYGQLSIRARKQLYAAAGAATWLAG